jgi:prevent-host-death family protein
MSRYSVADAKNGLPGLIDRALDGEEVIITRHGKAVAELRPVSTPRPAPSPATYAWLKSRRRARKPVGVSAVDLLNQLYEDPEA